MMKLFRSAWHAAFDRLGPPDGVTLPPANEVIFRGVACRTKGFGGGRWGPLLLTHEKLIWYEDHRIWPLERQYCVVDLAQVAAVGEGNILEAIGGGRRLSLRLKNGRSVKLYEGSGERKAWIDAVRRELSSRQSE